MVGRTILHYHVVEKLGEGGMGVVYKAEDTQLRRTVALKFLHQQMLDDEDVKERLIREAQAVASLDHPNICHVYGIHQEEGETFIAMAYIDGPSLGEKIKDRPLPLDDALSLATQIAEGLQEAHEKGVVHRDIKPQNILLTAKGQVKILDFGLAALSGRSKLTKAGTILGTPAYMSPEQLEGRETDRRTDIWALGCVLYEMLTQKTPFDAPYEQAIGYGILNEEPEPVTALRSGLPTEIDRLTSKALAKNPAERYQHVDDLLTDLRVLQKQIGDRKKSSGSSMTLPATHQQHALVALPPGSIIVRRSRHYQLIGAAAAVLLALLVVLGLNVSEAPQRGLPVTASIEPPSQRRPASIVFSPDGTFLLASLSNTRDASRNLLMVRALDSGQWREIPGTEGALYPFWSPDGTQIGFFADEQLKKVALAGGPSLVIADAPEGRGGSWAPDGTIVFSPVLRGPMQRVSESGGEVTQITQADERNSPGRRFPQFLPDGRHYLYLVTAAVEPAGRGVFVGSLDGGEPQRLLADESNAWFTPKQPGSNQGVLLFARDNVLMAQPFDAAQLEFTGGAIGLSAELAPPSVKAHYVFGASPSGSLAYLIQGTVTIPGQLAWLDRAGEVVDRTKLFAQFMGTPRLSPDGQKVAYVAQEGNKIDVWVYDLQLETRTRLSNDTDIALNPTWSADGRDVVFHTATSIGSLKVRSSDGSESAMDLSNIEATRALDWSSDGRFLLHTKQGPTSSDISYLERDPDGTWKSRLYITSDDRESHARFSPDGRYVSYVSTESGQPEVYVQPFPEGGQRTTVSQGSGTYPDWSGDGKELLYASGRTVRAVQVSTEGAFSMQGTTDLYDIPLTVVSAGDISVDGQRILIWARVPADYDGGQAPSSSGRDGSLRLLLNWQQKYFPEQ